MVRPKCPRYIAESHNTAYFKPRGIPLRDLLETTLTIDELEAIRLADAEGLYQEDAARQMQVSRATFGRIVESAHHKIADALINGKAIKIEGGVIQMAQKRMFKCSDCEHSWEVAFGTGRPPVCPQCGGKDVRRSDDIRGQGSGGRRIRCRKHRSVSAASEKENQ